jgi:outer membrane protein OmpA-like peptidoglycan-associated protein
MKNMRKSMFLALMVAMSTSAYSQEIKKVEKSEKIINLETEKHYIGVNNTLSGGILAISAVLSDRISSLNKEEIEKLNNFKKILNDKLQSDSIVQKVYFKTADAELGDKTVTYISNIIYSLKDFENLNYTINGYSDVRGDSTYNLGLSKGRSESVKLLILSLGIDDENISVENFGETKSLNQQNKEDYFFDRRVELKISKQ